MTIIERIHLFNKDLLPDKVRLKYQFMADNAFGFFRGSCHIFYEDLSNVLKFPFSPNIWICGDLHVENFGSFKGDNRLVYFDLNDFDESILAPAAWELARFLTSILVAFENLKITDDEAVKSCHLFLKTYSKILREGTPRYIEPQTARGIVKRFLIKVSKGSEKKLLKELTNRKGSKLVLDTGVKKLNKIEERLKKELIKAFKIWMKSNPQPPNNYRVLDVCFRIAGTGSIGCKRYLFLLQNLKNKNKYRFIDMKEATQSSLKPYLTTPQPRWESEAQRMVTVQKMMQNIPPAQVSILNFKNGSYFMHEMQPLKDKINLTTLEKRFKDVRCVIEDMALLTASAHLRTVSRKGACSADELMNFAIQQNWQEELIQYARKYKIRILKDFEEFKNSTKHSKT